MVFAVLDGRRTLILSGWKIAPYDPSEQLGSERKTYVLTPLKIATLIHAADQVIQ